MTRRRLGSVVVTDGVRVPRRWFLTAVPVAVVAMLLGVAQPASAESAAETAVGDQMAFGTLGPVGIAAVAAGFGGLVVGLLRRRRRTLAARPIPEARPAVTPVDADRAA